MRCIGKCTVFCVAPYFMCGLAGFVNRVPVLSDESIDGILCFETNKTGAWGCSRRRDQVQGMVTAAVLQFRGFVFSYSIHGNARERVKGHNLVQVILVDARVSCMGDYSLHRLCSSCTWQGILAIHSSTPSFDPDPDPDLKPTLTLTLTLTPTHIWARMAQPSIGKGTYRESHGSM